MNKHHSCGKHWLQLKFYKAALEDVTIEHRQSEAHRLQFCSSLLYETWIKLEFGFNLKEVILEIILKQPHWSTGTQAWLSRQYPVLHWHPSSQGPRVWFMSEQKEDYSAIVYEKLRTQMSCKINMGGKTVISFIN